MAVEKTININVTTKGASNAITQTEKLNSSFKKLNDTTGENSKSLKELGNNVLDNGGAMGLLNDATGGFAMTIKDAVEATALFSKEGKIMTTVNKGLAWAQGLWNAAMAANPIGLLVAAIAAVIAAGYLLIKFFMDSAAANEAAMNATKKNTIALERQTVIANQASEALKVKNNQLLALAKASGASAEEIRKLTLKYAEEEIAINKSNATIASNTFIRERNNLAVLKSKGVSEEAIAAQEKLTQATYKDLQNANKILQGSYDKKRDIVNNAEVEILQAKTDAETKASEDAKTKLAKDQADAIQAEKDKTQKILDARKEYLGKAEDMQKGFDELEIERLRIANKAEEDKKGQKEKNLASEAAGLESINALKKKKAAEEKALDEAVAEAKLQIANKAFDLLNVFVKKGSKIAKGVAVAQATMNTYQGITSALAAPSIVPEPFGTALKIANSVAIGVTGFMNVQKILATDGEGKGGGGASSGGGGASIPSAPSFNLVAGTGSNQIAEGLAGQRQPLQAYVVSGAVTNAQQMQRNIVDDASL